MIKFLKTAIVRWNRMSLVIRILIGLVCGTILGLACPQLTGLTILGVLFVSALKAIAPILVAVLVANSIANAKSGLGSRFRTVIALYLLSTFAAALVAVCGSSLFPVTMKLSDTAAEGNPASGLVEIFVNLAKSMVQNPVEAVCSANYIGVLFWSIVVGLALKLKANEKTIQVVGDFAEVISTVVKWVIQFAPFGVLGLVFSAVSECGMEIFTTYGKLVLLLVGCMAFAAFVVNPLISFLYTRRNPFPLLFTCLKESAISAFFTRSSAANIPVNMELCRKLNLSRDFYSVSIPLGSTINMDGAAITITVMALAVCHTLGIEVSFVSAIIICVLSTLAACGTSGVAGGSLLLIPMACSFFGISNDIAMQAVATGFIIGVIQDSVETALNSSADVFFTATAEWHEDGKMGQGSRNPCF